MNADTLRFIRKHGAGIHKETQRELWLNLTGKKSQTRLNGIYSSRPEFLEPELYHSTAEYAGSDEEEKARVMLISSFLIEAFVSGKTAKLTDRILSLEAGDKFSAAGEYVTLRSAKVRLLSEPKKYKRDEIIARLGEALSRLNTLCMRKLEALLESAEALGFRASGELMGKIIHIDFTFLEKEAERFLRDTDYIAGDMLEWFLSRKIDVRLKDSSFPDTEFLFNSAELHGYFPKPDFESLAGKVIGGMTLRPKRMITFDTARRGGKSAAGFSFTLGPPLETSISIFPMGGIEDYEALLGSLGHAICYSFTEAEDDFEFLFLRDPLLTGMFSELFKSILYEPAWLKKNLRIDAASDLHNFLNLRRLMQARLEAGRTLCIREIQKGGDISGLQEVFSDILSGAVKSRYDGRCFLPEFFSQAGFPFRFQVMLTAPLIRIFMKERYDEEWWRTSEAGDFLAGTWSQGGRITGDSLLAICQCGDAGVEILIRDFEKAFG